MQRRYNLAYFILASVVALVLTPLMVSAAQAQIAFASNRDGNYEIYVINTEGRRDQRRLTHNNHDDIDPVWFDPTFAVEVAPFAVAPAGKKLTLWGSLKQVNK